MKQPSKPYKSVSKWKRATSLLAIGILAGVLSACGSAGKEKKPEPKKEEVVVTPKTESPKRELEPSNLAEAVLAGQFDQVYNNFGADLKQQVSLDDFKTSATDFVKDVDKFELISTLKVNGTDIRTWLHAASNKGIVAVFSEEGQILGLQVQILPAGADTDNQFTKNTYSLPFKGDYLIYWGGTNVWLNYHYEYESQRYAYDIAQEKDGFTYKGDPAKNESYYAFGQEIVAPADGTVVSVLDTVADNEPVGVMNEKEPPGNVVIIDHGGEYSYLAHLKKGSAAVKPGDKVKRGDLIGLLGNSGNSSEPHLHFQVSNGTDLYDSQAIRIKWEDGLNPVRGQTVTGKAGK